MNRTVTKNPNMKEIINVQFLYTYSNIVELSAATKRLDDFFFLVPKCMAMKQ